MSPFTQGGSQRDLKHEEHPNPAAGLKMEQGLKGRNVGNLQEQTVTPG